MRICFYAPPLKRHAPAGPELIGWDVAVLSYGPAIIEANGLTAQDILQRIYKAPLGASRLGQPLAHHLTYGTRRRKP